MLIAYCASFGRCQGGSSRRHDWKGRPRALGWGLPGLAVSHRGARTDGGTRHAAPCGGSVLRFRRLDHRRALLSGSAPTAARKTGRADLARGLHRDRAATGTRICCRDAEEPADAALRIVVGELPHHSATRLYEDNVSWRPVRTSHLFAGAGRAQRVTPLVERAANITKWSKARFQSKARQLDAIGQGADPAAQCDDAQHGPQLAIRSQLDGRTPARGELAGGSKRDPSKAVLLGGTAAVSARRSRASGCCLRLRAVSF